MPIRHLRELIFQELIALSLSTKRQTTSQMARHLFALAPGCLCWYCVVVGVRQLRLLERAALDTLRWTHFLRARAADPSILKPVRRYRACASLASGDMLRPRADDPIAEMAGRNACFDYRASI